MNDVIISVENLSKRYRLGQIGATTLRDSVERWWEGLRGSGREKFKVKGEKPDLSTLDLAPLTPSTSEDPEELWALKDVSFEVKRGEVLGIIGRNGAGKSTLLKILSRITEPTSGRAIMRGRVASLLEVGTGFHPELTGRENIYLNGAILGMRHREITAKFDEIVAFAEVEKFIDTPVKRYSSGMYVRLAFAVAAHLDPEILLVDEVLAVGDASFQRKCMGKMQNVAQAGKTIFFVSHQMNAIRRLCSKCLWIDDGSIRSMGATPQTVNAYERIQRKPEDPGERRVSHTVATFTEWSIPGQVGDSEHTLASDIGMKYIEFRLNVSRKISKASFGVALRDKDERTVWANAYNGLDLAQGEQILKLTLRGLPVRPAEYGWLVSLYDGSALIDLWSAEPPLSIDGALMTHPCDTWAGILNIYSSLEVGVASDKAMDI